VTLTVRSATVTDATTKGSALTHAELDENFNHLRQSANHSFTPSGIGTGTPLAQSVETALRRGYVSADYTGAAGQLTAWGTSAMRLNTSGTDNAAFGYIALSNNTTGSSNQAFGSQAMASNTTGSTNTAMGRDALRANQTSSANCAFGNLALQSSTAGENSAFGSEALSANTTGTNNVAVGRGALKVNVDGEENVAVGIGTLGSHTNGDLNCAVGGDALSLITSGSYNTGLGTDALRALVTGSNNVGVGDDAGRYTGALADATAFENCVYVGQITKASAATGVTNENVFGFSATGFGSNTITLGNSSVTTIVAGADNTVDLGTAARRFESIYIGTSVLTPIVGSNAASALSLTTSGGTQVSIGHVASAANYWEFKGAATADPAQLLATATGSSTNIAMVYLSKGTGRHQFYANGAEQVNILSTASATRIVTLTGSNGANPAISVSGGGELAVGTNAWTFGIANSVSPTSPNRTLTVTIGATTYYIHAKTTND
jgi:hypothetical protein